MHLLPPDEASACADSDNASASAADTDAVVDMVTTSIDAAQEQGSASGAAFTASTDNNTSATGADAMIEVMKTSISAVCDQSSASGGAFTAITESDALVTTTVDADRQSAVALPLGSEMQAKAEPVDGKAAVEAGQEKVADSTRNVVEAEAVPLVAEVQDVAKSSQRPSLMQTRTRTVCCLRRKRRQLECQPKCLRSWT